jgi:hypothetical protein
MRGRNKRVEKAKNTKNGFSSSRRAGGSWRLLQVVYTVVICTSRARQTSLPSRWDGEWQVG